MKRKLNVLHLAIPMFVVAIILHAIYAVLMWRVNGDWVYCSILSAGLVVLWIAMIPVFKQLNCARVVKRQTQRT